MAGNVKDVFKLYKIIISTLSLNCIVSSLCWLFVFVVVVVSLHFFSYMMSVIQLTCKVCYKIFPNVVEFDTHIVNPIPAISVIDLLVYLVSWSLTKKSTPKGKLNCVTLVILPSMQHTTLKRTIRFIIPKTIVLSASCAINHTLQLEILNSIKQTILVKNHMSAPCVPGPLDCKGIWRST